MQEWQGERDQLRAQAKATCDQLHAARTDEERATANATLEKLAHDLSGMYDHGCFTSPKDLCP